MDVLHSITLVGAEAQAERQRLLTDGKEVNLVCRRRNARGADVSRSVFFGLCSEGAWVPASPSAFHRGCSRWGSDYSCGLVPPGKFGGTLQTLGHKSRKKCA